MFSCVIRLYDFTRFTRLLSISHCTQPLERINHRALRSPVTPGQLGTPALGLHCSLPSPVYDSSDDGHERFLHPQPAKVVTSSFVSFGDGKWPSERAFSTKQAVYCHPLTKLRLGTGYYLWCCRSNLVQRWCTCSDAFRSWFLCP